VSRADLTTWLKGSIGDQRKFDASILSGDGIPTERPFLSTMPSHGLAEGDIHIILNTADEKRNKKHNKVGPMSDGNDQSRADLLL
jgi:hypothetical protein